MELLKLLNKFVNFKTIAIGLLVLIAFLLVIQVSKDDEVITKQCKIEQVESIVDAPRCDADPYCGCLKKNWFGFGECQICKCVEFTSVC